MKGVTYSLDALLGAQTPNSSRRSSITSTSSLGEPKDGTIPEHSITDPQVKNEEIVRADEEFARVNGISYTLPDLISGSAADKSHTSSLKDQSTTPASSSEAEVRADFALAPSSSSWWNPFADDTSKALYYCVVYLAPGDYHRFHSPVAWVVESRRHFAGELYSVSPYLQKHLPGLFTLNERVVLLGRWKYGFFSYIPVGATNVGSIKINFDKELRTNSLLTDTAADRAAEEAAQRGEAYCGFSEATYEPASALLGGYALKRGEEMGGFQLGSTIVLVFEAPKREVKSDSEGGENKNSDITRGWKWNIRPDQKVKVGQALGFVEE